MTCPHSFTLSGTEPGSEPRPPKVLMRILCTLPNWWVFSIARGGGVEGDAVCNYNVLHMYSIYVLTPCPVPEEIRGRSHIAFGLTLYEIL